MMLPKRVGRDCELSTTGLTADGATIPSWRVTRDVLAHVEGALAASGGRVWSRRSSSTPGTSTVVESEYDSQDTLRHWTSTGQCFYSDMSHVEAVGAETLDPLQVAAQSLGVLRVCEAARRAAEAAAPAGTTYALTTANADILDPRISWGTHLNVAIAPELWRALFRYPRDRARLGYVSGVVAGLVPFFGAGYVLPLRAGARYSLSARAHHLTRLSTLPTTEAFRRGLLNERREAHSRVEDRLHLIGFDFSLAGSGLLTSMMQCALAAAEMGEGIESLVDPVRALRSWSWGLDPTSGLCRGVASATDGRRVGLPGFVRAVARQLLGLVEDGSISEAVAPRAGELLPRVIELTHYLDEGSIDRCAVHLDWAAKLLVLSDMAQRDGLQFDDLRIRVADHDYASSDPERGHFWRLWAHGRVDPLVTLDQVDATLVDGPADSRAWGRGQLVKHFCDDIVGIDWSYVDFAGAEGVRIDMPHTGSHSRADFGRAVQQAIDAGRVDRLLSNEGALTMGSLRRPSPI